MRAGDMRRQMVLQSRSTALTANRQQQYVWTNVATVWASITPMGGRELEIARAIQSESTHTVVIRYRPGVDTTMRLTYGGKVYNIDNINDIDMRHEALQLSCIEGLNDG